MTVQLASSSPFNASSLQPSSPHATHPRFYRRRTRQQRLFAGKISPDEILKRIEAAKVDTGEREKRRFYAELYIGLNEFVEGRNDSARDHLRTATASTWSPRAGYGPNYMWHVGRVQYEILREPAFPESEYQDRAGS